jgi:hypothetical protein
VRNWRASPGVPINHRIVLALHFGAVRCAAPAVTNSHIQPCAARIIGARVGLVSLVGSDNFDLHALGCCAEILHGELCRKPPISQETLDMSVRTDLSQVSSLAIRALPQGNFCFFARRSLRWLSLHAANRRALIISDLAKPGTQRGSATA